MSDSIHIKKSLLSDPRVSKIAASTQLGVDAVLGKLLRLWIWAADHAPSGIAPVTTAEIDELLECKGFAGSLLEVGMLEARIHEVFIPDSCENRRVRRSRLAQADRQAEQIPAPIPATLNQPYFQKLWGRWLSHKRASRRGYTFASQETQLEKLREWGLKRSIAALELSLTRGWAGIWEPEHKGAAPTPAQAQEAHSEESARVQELLQKQLKERDRARKEEERLRREQEREGSYLFGRPGNEEGRPQC